MSLPIRSLALVALLLASFSQAFGDHHGNKPNVLLFLVDDLKPAIGAYGDDLAITPHMDRLAERGTIFTKAYCNQAVCAPSRYNLMLGSRSTSTGLYGLGMTLRNFYPDAVTMPQFFKQHGYFSESLGKVYHVGHGNLGDDDSWSAPPYKDFVIEYALEESNDGQLSREEAFFNNMKGGRPLTDFVRGAAWEAPEVPDVAYADGRVAGVAIKKLRDAKLRGEPFFLAVGMARPHLPFTAPKKYWDMHDPAKFKLASNQTPPVGAPPYAPKVGLGEINNYKPIPEKPPIDPEMQRTIWHGYYASTTYADAQIGKVLDELDRLGFTENTLIVLWGDHGWHLGDLGSWTKHTNYEQANRIPLIFAGPGVTEGAVTDALAATVDVFPTLTELAGLGEPDVTQPMDGTSQAAVLADPEADAKEYVYHAYPRGGQNRIGQAIRTDRYRFVKWSVMGDADAQIDYELYDYLRDPLERKNIAAEAPEVVAKMKEIIAELPEPMNRARPVRN